MVYPCTTANAVIHRDYSTGNPIHIHIYHDEVLIYNDGRLPETWSVEDLFKRHTSLPYNPLIASTFFRSGQIEAWGRGIQKITESCRFWGKPEPFYKVTTNEVMIGFNTDANIGDNIRGKKVISATQTRILALMMEEPTVSAKAIATVIGIAPRNVEENIRSMKRAGLIDRAGPSRGGRWVIKK